MGNGRKSAMSSGFGGTGGFNDFSGNEVFPFGGTGYSDFFEQFFGMRRGCGFGGGTQFEETPQRGSDVETDILVTLEEVLSGARRQISSFKAGSQGLQTCTVNYETN